MNWLRARTRVQSVLSWNCCGLFVVAVPLLFVLVASAQTTDYTSFEQRAQAVRQTVASLSTNTILANCSDQPGYDAEICFLNGRIADGNAIIDNYAKNFIPQLPYPAPANFLQPWCSIMHCTMRFGQYYTPTVSNDVRQVVLGIGSGLWGQSTDNLTLLATTIHYFGTQLYGNVLSDGVTHAANGSWLASRCASIINSGIGEFASLPYGAMNLIPLMGVAKYADDPMLRTKALMAYQEGLAQYAGFWVAGSPAVYSGRTYPDAYTQKLWGGPELIWLHYGGSTPSLDATGNATAGFSGLEQTIDSVNRLPDPVVHAATDRSQPFVCQSRNGGLYPYTWNNKRYGLFCVMTDGSAGWQMKQTYGGGAMWMEPNANNWNFLWVTCPMEDAGSDQGLHCHGVQDNWTQWFQYQGTQVIMASTNGYGASFYPYLLCFVPGSYQAVINDSRTDGRVYLAYNDNILIALSAVAPFSWDLYTIPKTRYSGFKQGDSEFRINKNAANGMAGMAVETALPEEFPGTTPLERLTAFRAAILQHGPPVLTGAGQQTIVYTDRFGNTLQKTLAGDSFLNGTNVNVARVYNCPQLQNPWMSQPVGGELSVWDGTNAVLYDSRNWVVAQGKDFGLKATVVDNSVVFSWKDFGSGQTGWTLESSSDDVNFSTLVNLPGTALGFTNTQSEQSWYCYRLKPTGGSTPTNFYSAPVPVRTYPRVPTSVRATAQSDTSIRLTWNDNSSGEASYLIEWSADGGDSWYGWWSAAANATSYTISGLSTGAVSYFRVAAIDAYNNKYHAYSNPAGTRALASLSGTSVSVPAMFKVVSGSSNSVILSWVNLASDATRIIVERSPDNINWTALITNLPASATAFTNSSLSSGVTYYYRVKCNNGSTDSAYTDALTGSALSLTAPAGLAATNVNSSEIQLTWTDTSTGELNFVIERSTDSNAWVVSTSAVATGTTSWTDCGLNEGTVYYYRLRSAFGTNTSSPSAVASTRTMLGTPLSICVYSNSTTKATVYWLDNSQYETSYSVERWDSVNGWVILTSSLPANTITYVDNTFTTSTTYYYRVRCANSYTTSAYSDTALVNTSYIWLQAPTSVTATTISDTEIYLQWNDVANYATANRITRSSDGVNWSVVATAAPCWAGFTGDSYYDSTLAENTHYNFTIQAVGGVSLSPAASASAFTMLHPPVNFAAQSVSSSQNYLTWSNQSHAAMAIKLERSPDNSAWTTLSSTLPPGTTSYTDSGLSQSSYYYRLTATVSSNTSPSVVVQSSALLAQAPQYLTATTWDTNRITLAWQDVAVNETAYSVERSPNGSNAWTVLTAGLPPNTQSYIDAALTTTTNYYRIRCQSSGGGWGAYSSVVQGVAFVPPPPTISVFSLNNGLPNLLIGGSTGFTYTLQGSTNLMNWTNLYTVTLSSPTVHWTDTNATSSNQRFYRVLQGQ